MIVGLFIGLFIGVLVTWLADKTVDAVQRSLIRYQRENIKAKDQLILHYMGKIDCALSQVTPKANATVKRMAKILRGEA